MNGHVRPGEIISSAAWNGLLDQMALLEQRVRALEGGIVAGNLITRFEPPAQQEVGRTLTAFGTFDFPPSRNEVTIDGVRISDFLPLSNDVQLLFIIPMTITVPPGGSRIVTIRVRNSKGEDAKSYRLLPETPSTVPRPAITGVVDQATGTVVLNGGERALISGQNFAADPSQNDVRFHIQLATGTVTYPRSGDPPIAIDAAQSSPTQIVVTVPVVAEIGANVPVPVAVSVAVGAATPAMFGSPNNQLLIRRRN